MDIRYKCYICNGEDFTINVDEHGLRFDCKKCKKPSGTTEVEDFAEAQMKAPEPDDYDPSMDYAAWEHELNKLPR